jgi:hypothetical protein
MFFATQYAIRSRDLKFVWIAESTMNMAPFFRTSPGRETETGGTSLGLAIASEAVRLRDETIAARGGHSWSQCPKINTQVIDLIGCPPGIRTPIC